MIFSWSSRLVPGRCGQPFPYLTLKSWGGLAGGGPLVPRWTGSGAPLAPRDPEPSTLGTGLHPLSSLSLGLPDLGLSCIILYSRISAFLCPALPLVAADKALARFRPRSSLREVGAPGLV